MENKIDVKKIAEQNDKFRKTFCGGKVLLTCGISSLPLMQQQEIMQKVRTKIDMYDLNYEFYSPQPDDETQTNRVLTIMFADEY